MNSTQLLKEKIGNAKSLDFGTIFSQILEIYKKVWVQGLLLFIFNILILLPILITFYVPLISASLAQSELGNDNPDFVFDFLTGFSVLYGIGFLLMFVVLITAVASLNAAFYRIIKRLDYDEKVETSDFFYFLKRKYLLKVLVLTVLSIIIAGLSAILCYLPLIYTMVPLSFFLVFFAFNPALSVSDIFELSFKLGTKKWLITFCLLIVVGILVGLIGTITCGLGYLFLTPFSYLPVYIIYKEVIGFEENNEINEIGSHILD